MQRFCLTIAVLIFLGGVVSPIHARWTVRPSRKTTTTTATTTTTTPTPIATSEISTETSNGISSTSGMENDLVDDGKTADDSRRIYHPAAVQRPRLIEHYDQRNSDGHYEYRYVLSNGDTKYERAYWETVGTSKFLARKGYYSYPLPSGEYLTVFYTADHNGYHQDSSKFSQSIPALPRTLDVPEQHDLSPTPESSISDDQLLTSSTTMRTTHRRRNPNKKIRRRTKTPQAKINYEKNSNRATGAPSNQPTEAETKVDDDKVADVVVTTAAIVKATPTPTPTLSWSAATPKAIATTGGPTTTLKTKIVAEGLPTASEDGDFPYEQQEEHSAADGGNVEQSTATTTTTSPVNDDDNDWTELPTEIASPSNTRLNVEVKEAAKEIVTIPTKEVPTEDVVQPTSATGAIIDISTTGTETGQAMEHNDSTTDSYNNS